MASVGYNNNTISRAALLSLTLTLGGMAPLEMALAQPEPIPAPPQTPPAKPTNPYAKLDRLQEQGTLIKIPAVRDSVLTDVGGFRSDLARYGIGVQLVSLNNAVFDSNTPSQSGRQHYSGQDLTIYTTQQFIMTYDLGQDGNDQTQLILGAVADTATWEPMGPRTKGSLSRLAYYRSFNDRQWEIKGGYLSNALEFIGIYTGGSLAGGAQGPNSVIPFQLGLSRLPMASPGLNITYNSKAGYYNKLGLQRSTSPDGAQVEVDTNSHGFRWRTDHTGLLAIDEIGLKKAASASNKYKWIRGGFLQNESNYKRFDEADRSSSNYMTYAAADVQITQPDANGLPFQGWYVGGSFNYAPPDRNLYSRYYEGRLYRLGTFASRPFDMISLTYSHSVFSDDAIRVYRGFGVDVESDTTSITASYMTRLHSGVYLSTGISHVQNPAFTPKLDNALNLLVGLNMFF
ncbi:carbohydrate porin [Pseudomonas sp. NCHU5208]|uniref:carbohydrate porin n=1 Tax=unclassified Pseudomonas TaxID=196821 RepID=UPI003F9C6FBB